MIATQTGAAPLVRKAPAPTLAETDEFLSQRRVDGPAVTLLIFPTARAELIFHFGDRQSRGGQSWEHWTASC